MKKILLIIVILFFAVQAWGATVYVKKIASTVYYESGASSCDDVTTADTSGDIQDAVTAAGASGTCTICEGTYTDGDIDSTHFLTLPDTAITLNATGAILNSTDATQTVRIGANSTINGGTYRGGTTQTLYILRDSTITIDSITIDNTSGTYGIYGFADASGNISGVTISNSVFSITDVEAIRFQLGATGQVYDIDIDSNTFTGVRYGIQLFSLEAAAGANDTSPYNIQITDNTFSNTTRAAIQVLAGIKSTGGTSYISGNVLKNIGNGTNTLVNAMQLQWCRGLVVEDNIITTVNNASAGDGDGIILDWAFTSNSYLSDGCIVRRNIIYGCDDATPSSGIDFYKVTDSKAYNNICYGNNSGIRLSNIESTGNEFYNNTLFNNLISNVRFDDPATAGGAPASTWKNNIISSAPIGIDLLNSSTAPTETYNCYYNNTSNDITPDATSVLLNPLLVQTWKLKEDSPALGEGVGITDINDGGELDIAGNAARAGDINIGAYYGYGMTGGGGNNISLGAFGISGGFNTGGQGIGLYSPGWREGSAPPSPNVTMNGEAVTMDGESVTMGAS